MFGWKRFLYTISDLFSRDTFNLSSNINVLGGPERLFRFILFYRTLFYENDDHNVRQTLGFAFVQSCIVAKNASVKERRFSDDLINSRRIITRSYSLCQRCLVNFSFVFWPKDSCNFPEIIRARRVRLVETAATVSSGKARGQEARFWSRDYVRHRDRVCRPCVTDAAHLDHWTHSNRPSRDTASNYAFSKVSLQLFLLFASCRRPPLFSVLHGPRETIDDRERRRRVAGRALEIPAELWKIYSRARCTTDKGRTGNSDKNRAEGRTNVRETRSHSNDWM